MVKAANVPIKGGNKSLKNVTIPDVISELFLKEQSIKESKLFQKEKTMYPATLLNEN